MIESSDVTCLFRPKRESRRQTEGKRVFVKTHRLTLQNIVYCPRGHALGARAMLRRDRISKILPSPGLPVRRIILGNRFGPERLAR